MLSVVPFSNMDNLETNIQFTDDEHINGDSVCIFTNKIDSYLAVARKPEPERTLYIVKGRLIRMFGLSANEARSELFDIQQAMETKGYGPEEIAEALSNRVRFFIGVSITLYEWRAKKAEFIEGLEGH